MDGSKEETYSDRFAPLEIEADVFRELGHELVDQVADFLATLPERPVTTGESPSKIRSLLGESPLPQQGTDAKTLLKETANLLFDHSLFNGHPKYWGYISSSAAPIGILGDFLAAAVNPNVGAWNLSPVASEIERQTIKWIAEMVGYPLDCGGLLVSGGNMANFVGFLAGRYAKAGWDVGAIGQLGPEAKRLRVYASAETHTWINKAADMFGLGTDSIRWIQTDADLRMDTDLLKAQIENDLKNGDKPFLVVGTAGSVSTGVTDPLAEIANICREYDLWFHADGAYGALAACLPDAEPDLKALTEADSIALDPHKWLYAPLEAGCTLVRDSKILRDTFNYQPPYYKFDEVGGEPTIVYNEYGPQNSRGFRALKVWLGLKQVGRSGYERMISDDIKLAEKLYQLADKHGELEAFSHNLSITTFRYVPEALKQGHEERETYLNQLNTEILTRLQEGGEAFVSNAMIAGKYVLRACIVNFRTNLKDIEALPEIVIRIGRKVDAELQANH
ncbi:aminotransferase class V-fold PLP-dependent enzyme [candidate division KSB1 bacterium]|nr:aminotransferase class V-fold PLP-dependent enzyme [candidate division KSB1 bacterium]